MGELATLNLKGCSMEHFDELLEGGRFNERLSVYFTKVYGAHTCGTKGEPAHHTNGGG